MDNVRSNFAVSVPIINGLKLSPSNLRFVVDAFCNTNITWNRGLTLLSRAGLTPMQILASLTTAPAARWRQENRRGRVSPGFDADLVVLNADPATDVSHFANVKCTFRRGREIFTPPSSTTLN